MNALRFGLAPLFVLAAACSGAPDAPKDPATTTAALSPAAHRAAMIARFDKNQDGKLQVSELPPRLAEHLADADLNKDGTLTDDELAAAHQKRAEAHFAKLDADGDGKLPLASLPADLPPFAHERLAAGDTDHDGVLTKAEFLALPPPPHGHGPDGHGPGGHGPGGHGRFLERLDANKDGTIQVSELPADLPAPFREHLVAADTNKDGVLSKEELEAARPKGPEGHRGHGPGDGPPDAPTNAPTHAR